MPTKSRSSTTTELIPNPHPGDILMEEFLKPMALSQTALAKALHVPPRRINEIVLGKRAITALEPSGLRSPGSHAVMARSTPDAGRAVCVVPVHDELAVGTLRGVLRQTGDLPDEFIAAPNSLRMPF